MVHFRKALTVKNKLDKMIEKLGRENIVLDHGVGAYEFSHYEFEEGNCRNKWNDTLIVYYVDFDKNNTVREYMRVTDDMLKKPSKDDWGEFVCCYWEKEYPTLLFMREYTIF